MSAFEDNALMEKVKAGDTSKLGLLFERYHKQLFGFYYRMNSNAAKSEDMVQTVFYRILKYRHTFDPKGKFITWMYHIARNVLKDDYKKSKRMEYKDSLASWEERLTDHQFTDQPLVRRQELNTLQEAMDRLSPEKKEVLVLSKYQELKYDEIGVIMNCSVAAVKVRVHRALNELKTIYQKLEA